ncbi:MAG: 2OG-Fe dioxygenase family protein [Flavisolibacter sp.]
MISSMYKSNETKALQAEVNPHTAPRELDLSQFLFESMDASSFMNIKSWSKFFDLIPVDPYIREGYRYKAIAWFRVKHDKASAIAEIDQHILQVNKLSGMSEEQSKKFLSSSPASWHSNETGYSVWKLPQYAMQQSIQYNPVHGDMRREYPRIDESIMDSEDFHRLLIHYASFFGWSDAIVLVQFQRVDCLANRIGQPTVEGFHQDGNRHVGMLVVNRENITDDSGVSQYVMDENGKKTDHLIFDEVLPPGKLIYWNDKRVWHYGSDLKLANPNVNGGRGVRDIIIMSAKTPPANMPIGPVPVKFRNW